MSKKTPDPVPAGKKPDTDTTFEEPGQDESGKTAAPQSPQGPQQKTKTAKPDAANGKKHGEDRPM
ncbi:hypothetical protein GobsT_50540 [Gemmata obscuriglobus]|uniref:Uncharacterized protein n=1 Tax=Gemmata obscuriglobus TaxID=114 RepID=A0A2Z3GYC3_9BACT|nr:hypothetical protein [Gemmata obscuriglobus]AWM37042.1 hypothetical protein C1280_08415 [Gemmata obscuriglobus]QEG30251.1 hypothetical protein GobsT_50540 [Gemmata obscuriglobus]VTS09575.1 unnamed protein product [Gemmata obscuriglobus UQM 2246]